MGLFKKKELKTFERDTRSANQFIQSLASGWLEVKIGQKIKVEPGFWALIVLKDKPRDLFEEGEWLMSLDRIPEVNKLLKLDKPVIQKRRGAEEKVYRNDFKCDMYYISRAELVGKLWQTGNISLKLPDKRRYTVALGGTFDFRCTDPKALIKFCLYEWARFEEKKVIEHICDFVGLTVMENVPSIKDIEPIKIDAREEFAVEVLPLLNKNLAKFGLEITKLTIDKVDFSLEVAAELAQIKLEQNLASDEINELGAEISVKDEKATKESRRIFAEVVTPSKHEVLDMTDGEVVKNPAQKEMAKTAEKVDEKSEKSDTEVSPKERENLSEESQENTEILVGSPELNSDSKEVTELPKINLKRKK